VISTELISTVAGVELLVQSLAEQDDGATWTLFPAGSAVARHPAREQSRSFSPKTTTLAIAIGLPLQPLNAAVPFTPQC
jgi:hypothetical protein